MSIRNYLGSIATFAMLVTQPVYADMFGTGTNSFEIAFVSIGALGNAADREGAIGIAQRPGAVDYTYRISEFEITAAAVNSANLQGGLGISFTGSGPNKPAANVSWFEAARFVNWLNTSQGFTPAYKFNETTVVGPRGIVTLVRDFALWEPEDIGYDPDNLFRNSLANYVLPSLDEWYKAAFYDPVLEIYYPFAAGQGSIPVQVFSGNELGTAVYGQNSTNLIGSADVYLAGGSSPFGTVGQSGNVAEILETTFSTMNASSDQLRIVGGGSFGSALPGISSSELMVIDPALGTGNIGFRVVSLAVPEPSSVCGFGLVCVALRIYIRCKRSFSDEKRTTDDRFKGS